TSGLQASWRQIAPGRDDQIWSLGQPKEDSGFKAQITSKEPTARDIAVLVSIADNVEPMFAVCQKTLPPLRAFVHIMRPGGYPHVIRTPGQATDVALAVQDGMRTARREYGNIGTAHLFMAAPAGLAMLIGQLLNTFGSVQTYEPMKWPPSCSCHFGVGIWRRSISLPRFTFSCTKPFATVTGEIDFISLIYLRQNRTRSISLEEADIPTVKLMRGTEV